MGFFYVGRPHFPLCPIPDIFNPPFAIPDVLNPLSVIPDVFNRESTGCSHVGAKRMKGQKRKTLDSR